MGDRSEVRGGRGFGLAGDEGLRGFENSWIRINGIYNEEGVGRARMSFGGECRV